jgi:hypothetical protein
LYNIDIVGSLLDLYSSDRIGDISTSILRIFISNRVENNLIKWFLRSELENTGKF